MQKQNITDEYSCGIYNGLELALAILEEREPKFVFVEKRFVSWYNNQVGFFRQEGGEPVVLHNFSFYFYRGRCN